jgi:hypothetical protein
MPDDLDRRFNYHPPDAERVGKHERVRAACREFAERLVDDVPVGRERDQALDALELVMFHANAGIARNGR